MRKILTIFILGIISFLLVGFVIVPKKNFSEIENRSLASMPKFSIYKIVDGTYMKDFETYINDNFLFRDIFMNIRTFTNRVLGKQNIGDVYFGNDNYLFEYYSDIEKTSEISEVINKLYNTNQNINYSVMFVPTKIGIYSDKLPSNAEKTDQNKIIENIYIKIDDGINKINIYDSLIKEKEDYQLYYKTDHHWTTYGSYFGYKEFAINNNIDYIDISLFDIEVVSDSFIGSTYSKVVDPFSLDEEITLFNYKNYDLDVSYVISNKNTKTLYNYEYLNKKDKYAMFLDNNHPLIKIVNNDINDSSNILIIKDSYANSMIPFLVNHYNNIHIIDPRYYKKSISKYINENNIDNVLILYNIGTLSSDDNILSIR